MKPASTLFIIFILLPAVSAFAQTPPDASGSLTARAEITRVDASCSVSGLTSLDFGGLQRPTSGTGTATIDPSAASSAAFSYVDGGGAALTTSGSPSWGTARVSSSNASTMTATLSSPPTALRRSGDAGCNAAQASDAQGSCTLPLSLTWAGATESADPLPASFTSISGTTDTVSDAGGEGGSAARQYRIGGSLTSLSLSTVIAVYEATVTLNVSCPN